MGGLRDLQLDLPVDGLDEEADEDVLRLGGTLGFKPDTLRLKFSPNSLQVQN